MFNRTKNALKNAIKSFLNLTEANGLSLQIDELLDFEANAFVRCEKLRTVTLPSSVTSLGDGAFSHCHVLGTVTCKATTPPTIGDEVFGDNKKLTAIYVPSGSVNAYKAADGWKDYASLIKPINS